MNRSKKLYKVRITEVHRNRVGELVKYRMYIFANGYRDALRLQREFKGRIL